jgi:isochorismate hydrolase
MNNHRKEATMTENDSSTQNLILREDSVLIVIDIQEKLMPVIANREQVIDNAVRLLKFSQIIGLPVIVTEQEKLGSTVPEIKGEIRDFNPISKLAFDCFLCGEFADHVRQIGRDTLILTGVETHVCVAQTALHALPHFRVHVASDAVSSRTLNNWNIGLERMRQSGAVISSTEMIIFELLQQAGTDEFRATLPLVK